MRHPLLSLAVLVALSSQAWAQGDDSVKAKKIVQPERLFRSRETLAFTIKAPFKTIFKDRDTTDTQATPGVIVVGGEGAKEIPVTLSTRGHFRLKRTTCSFPPLKVKFDKEAAKGTVFSGQGSIKLGTHCQAGASYEQNVLVEEAIYRTYNLLTSFSHLSRLAKVTYYDTEDTTKTVTR